MTDTAPPAIDYDQLGTAIAKSIGPTFSAALAEANKPIAETLAKLATPAAPAAAEAGQAQAGGAKPLSIEDIDKLVSQKLQGFQQQSQATAARQQFLTSKMGDLPEEYQGRWGTIPPSGQPRSRRSAAVTRACLPSWA